MFGPKGSASSNLAIIVGFVTLIAVSSIVVLGEKAEQLFEGGTEAALLLNGKDDFGLLPPNLDEKNPFPDRPIPVLTDIADFNLSPVENAEPDSIVFSAYFRLFGFTGTKDVEVAGIEGDPAVSIHGNPFSSSGVLEPGMTLRLRITASPDFNKTRFTSLKIGDDVFNFIVTTRKRDLAIDEFTFSNVIEVEPNTVVSTNTARLSDFDGPLSVFVREDSGPGFDFDPNTDPDQVSKIVINGKDPVQFGKAMPGSTVQFQVKSSDGFNEERELTVGMGQSETSFKIVTRDGDNLPNDPGFAILADQEPDSLVQSEVVLINGFDRSIPLSIDNGLYSINEAAFSQESVRISTGDSLQLQGQSPIGFDERFKVSFSAGAGNFDWVIQTKTDGIDDFTLPNINNLDPNEKFRTEVFTPEGIIEDFVVEIMDENNILRDDVFLISENGKIVGASSAIFKPEQGFALEFTTRDDFNESDVFRVRIAPLTAPALMKSTDFQATTRPIDSEVEELELVDATGLLRSETITKKGILQKFDDTAIISVSNSDNGNPEVSLDGINFDESIEIASGNEFFIRATAPANLNETTNIPILVDGSLFTWKVGTEIGSCPANIDDFGSIGIADPASTVVSNRVVLRDFNENADRSVLFENKNLQSFSVTRNGAALNEGDTVSPGDELEISVVMPDSFTLSAGLTIKIGSQCSISFAGEVREKNILELDFEHRDAAVDFQTFESDPKTVGPLDDVSATISLSGSASGEWRLKKANGEFGAYTTDDLTVEEGDVLQIKNTGGTNQSASHAIISEGERHIATFSVMRGNFTPCDFHGFCGPGFPGTAVDGTGSTDSLFTPGSGFGPNGVACDNSQWPAFSESTNLAPLSLVQTEVREIPLLGCFPAEFYELQVNNAVGIVVNGIETRESSVIVPVGALVSFKIISPEEFDETKIFTADLGPVRASKIAKNMGFVFAGIPPVTNANINEVINSNTVVVGPLPDGKTIDVSIFDNGVEISHNGGPFLSSGSTINISGDDTIQLRMTAPSAHDTAIQARIVVDGQTHGWTVGTAPDKVPFPVAFEARVNAEPEEFIESNEITISDIDENIFVIMSHNGESEVLVNGTSSGSGVAEVSNGDKVILRAKLTNEHSKTFIIPVSIGPKFSTNWTIKTRDFVEVTARNDNISITPGQPSSIIPASRLLANDASSTGSPVIKEIVSANGALVSFDAPSQEISVTPFNPNGGSFSFDYSLQGDSINVATVNVTISNANPCPEGGNAGQRICIFDIVSEADHNKSITYNYFNNSRGATAMKTTFYEFKQIPGVNNVFVEIWGAGGAGGDSAGFCGALSGNGAGGAYISGNIELSDNESILIGVGSGGRSGDRGGRLTGIMRNGEWFAIAGSGGAGGSSHDGFAGGQGGAGGIETGQSGSAGSGSNFGRPSGGGTQTSGGAGGFGNFGGQQGGRHLDSGKYHGDGGDGFFGGGASGWGTPSGGGGGSSLLPEGWSGEGGNRRVPGNDNEISKYTSLKSAIGGLGRKCGGNLPSHLGGDGLIVIHY